uniref:Matrix-remodelling associated 7 n=1 Tax=Sinocyclocheilus rhinocerous TaxID=307959 RepID=A0A673NQZ6_9TELE
SRELQVSSSSWTAFVMTLTSSSWRSGGPSLSAQSRSDPAQSSFSEAEMDIESSSSSSWPNNMKSAMLGGGWKLPSGMVTGEGNAEKKPLRYMAGMLRTCQLEKMMTKEELEEEQRVQREQLAAIFQLLKEKQDTFGEVTESDLQEQLKLYSV